MEVLKYGVWVLWFGSVGAFWLGNAATARAGQMMFVSLAVAHFAEFLWKRPLFRELGGNQTQHLLQTMIYGLFYWKPLEDRLRKG